MHFQVKIFKKQTWKLLVQQSSSFNHGQQQLRVVARRRQGGAHAQPKQLPPSHLRTSVFFFVFLGLNYFSYIACADLLGASRLPLLDFSWTLKMRNA